jgi:hypothetical protein
LVSIGLVLSEEKIFEKVYDGRRTTTTDAKRWQYGLIGIELPVSMYTTKTPIDTFYHQLKKILTFSVKDRYQLNYYVPPSNEGRHIVPRRRSDDNSSTFFLQKVELKT